MEEHYKVLVGPMAYTELSPLKERTIIKLRLLNVTVAEFESALSRVSGHQVRLVVDNTGQLPGLVVQLVSVSKSMSDHEIDDLFRQVNPHLTRQILAQKVSKKQPASTHSARKRSALTTRTTSSMPRYSNSGHMHMLRR